MSVTESPDTAQNLPGGGALEPDPDAEIVFAEAEPEPAPGSEMPEGAPSGVPMAGDAPAPGSQPSPRAQVPPVGAAPTPGTSADGLSAVLQIPIVVEIVLGTARMTVSELAALGKGSKIPLDRKVGEPVDVVVNGRVIAHGSVVMLDDGTDRFGISLESLAGQETKANQAAVSSA